MPSLRPVQLIDGRDPNRPFITAELRRNCPAEFLDTLELQWAVSREQLAATVPVEHAHWSWCNKSDSVAAGIHGLIAVECEGEVQGLMAVCRAPRTAVLSRGSLIYIDYLEAAPWNLRVATLQPRFAGVGTALLIDAIRLSREEGHEGRVGLHSLPQAEAFYARCGLTRVGLDPTYYDLPYYEYTSQQAVDWLASIGSNHD
jgi:GNAT superfamily N-acetyltransferase